MSVFPTISGAEGKYPATMCATIPMRPLCYHVPLELEEVDYSRPYSQLVVTGNFSMPQVHTWLGAALSWLPAMPSGLGLGLGGPSAGLGGETLFRSPGSAPGSPDVYETPIWDTS